MPYTQPLISSDAGDFSPYLRLNAEQSIPTRNQIHELLGGGIAVTFGGDTLATSSLEMLFTSEAASLDAYNKLNAGHIFELTDYSKTSTSMYFVIAGDIRRTLEVESQDVWIITCDIQQVEP